MIPALSLPLHHSPGGKGGALSLGFRKKSPYPLFGHHRILMFAQQILYGFSTADEPHHRLTGRLFYQLGGIARTLRLNSHPVQFSIARDGRQTMNSLP